MVQRTQRPDRLARFQREARSVAALNHPHIVTIFSVEEADEFYFLTMELVEGQSLDRVIPSSGLSIGRIVPQQPCRARSREPLTSEEVAQLKRLHQARAQDESARACPLRSLAVGGTSTAANQGRSKDHLSVYLYSINRRNCFFRFSHLIGIYPLGLKFMSDACPAGEKNGHRASKQIDIEVGSRPQARPGSGALPGWKDFPPD
jgi:hypothetical protein